MPKNTMVTSRKVAYKAAKTLTNNNSSQIAKSKQTRAKVESLASKALKSTKYNSIVRALSASVLCLPNKEK
ncbi:hypothetical protein ACMZOO_03440 [Catenovulum sp. SX2]|uniref:hypothetical protein n=1 Tax=Catenovulum sp. SX2 TaxID=3398614 RepID=UPI003F849193